MRLIKTASRIALFAIAGIVLFHITGCDDKKSAPIKRASITVSDAIASEGSPSDSAIFDFNLSVAADRDVVINYTVSGTADSSDHNISTGTITIPRGQKLAQLTVIPTDDNLEELAETVVIKLEKGKNYVYVYDKTLLSASVTIAANDTPEVTITATDASAEELVGDDPEEVADNGEFTISLSTIPRVAKTITFANTGSAQDGSDYSTTGTSIEIPEGVQTGIIPITVINDDLEEIEENVVLSLAEGSGYTVGAANSATVTIGANDTPTVTVRASDAYSAESGNEGIFLFELTRVPMEAKTINYSMSNVAINGTDYLTLSGTLIVEAGKTAETLILTPLDDPFVEGNEIAELTVNATTTTPYTVGSPNVASVVVTDDDFSGVSIAATDTTATEGSSSDPYGEFTLTIPAALPIDLVVNYVVSGSAGAGDYTPALTGSTTIPRGDTYKILRITPVDDSSVEADETLTLTLAVGIGYSISPSSSATVTIYDNNVTASVAASAPNAAEGGADGQFTITLSDITSSARTVNYSVATGAGQATPGDDYPALSGTITIPAGVASKTIDIAAVSDGLEENAETITITLEQGLNYIPNSSPATVTITANDEPIVSLINIDATASEDGDSAEFQVSLSTVPMETKTISLAITGTATNGTDYEAIASTVVVPQGQTSITVTINPIEDVLVEGHETVTATLVLSTGYTIGGTTTLTGTIADNDITGVSVTATDAIANESGDTGKFTIAIPYPLTIPITVAYTISGSATNGSDYTTIPTSKVITAGQTFVEIDITAIDEDPALQEADETVTISLIEGTNYVVSVTNTATVTIYDKDVEASIEVTGAQALEDGTADGEFTVRLSSATNSARVVYYTVSTSLAESGIDFTALTGSITIPALATSNTIPIEALDDNREEGVETITVTLTEGTNYVVAASPGDTATVTIPANDTPVATILLEDGYASENGDSGEVEIVLSTIPMNPVPVTMTISTPVLAGGIAENGVDYQTISSTVTVNAFETSKFVEIIPIDDSLVEGEETVGLTVNGTTVTVLIADDDNAGVFLRVIDKYAVEDANPADTATFNIYIGSPVPVDLDVYYTVYGAAVNGEDYESLNGKATILKGDTSVDVVIDPLTDTLVEGDEIVNVLLATGDGYVIGSPNPVELVIGDNEVEASISASVANAVEGGANGEFTVTLNSTASVDRNVNYIVSGTANNLSEYTNLSGNVLSGVVTVPAGSTTATIDVVAVDDDDEEASQPVIVTLAAGNGYTVGAADDATVTISANDTPVVTIAVDNATIIEGTAAGSTARFTVSLSTKPMNSKTVRLTVGGSVDGSDYTITSGQISIATGVQTGFVDLTADVDSLGEPDETATVTVTTPGTGGTYIIGDPATATTTILANETPVVSLAVTPSADIDEGDTATFTFSLNNAATTDTYINYTVSGVDATDYVAVSGTVKINATTTSNTVAIVTIDDNLEENAENLTVTVTAGTGYTGTPFVAKTIKANDTPIATIQATDLVGTESGDTTEYTVYLSTTPMVSKSIAYSVTGGTASGTDYVLTASPLEIAAGVTSGSFILTPSEDLLVEGAETVIVSLSTPPTGYTVGAPSSATTTISDNDQALVSIVASTAVAMEDGPVDGVFTVSTSQNLQYPLTVNYAIDTVTGTATEGDDYALFDDTTALTGTVTVPVGGSVDIDVKPEADTSEEGNETVVLKLLVGDGYLVSTLSSTATVIISDEDTDVTIAAGAAIDEGETGTFTVTADFTSAVDRVITFAVSGGATYAGQAAADHDLAATGTVTILANELTSTIEVTATPDDLEEGAESIVVTLNGTGSGYVPSTSAASLNINANDTPVATLKLDVAAIEESTDGNVNTATFTVELSTVAMDEKKIPFEIDNTSGVGIASASDYTLKDSSGATLTAPLVITVPKDTNTGFITLTAVVESSPALAEPDEDATLKLRNSSDSNAVGAYDLSATDVLTTKILANQAPTVDSITVNNDPITEGDTVQFTFTLSHTSTTPIDINYEITGVQSSDYEAVTGTVTIPANVLSNTASPLSVVTIDDNLEENAEDLTVTVTAGTGYTFAAPAPFVKTTIDANDEPVATIVATDAYTTEAGDTGLYTVTLSTVPMETKSITFAPATTSTATLTDDYTLDPATTLAFSVGQTTGTILVTPKDDTVVEGSETLNLQLDPVLAAANYMVGSQNTAAVTIADDDIAIVTIAATDAIAAEQGTDTGTFTVSISDAAEVALVVNYAITGSASETDDYDLLDGTTVLTGTVTILEGDTSADITVKPKADTVLNEGDETVTLTLEAGVSYNVSTAVSAATVTIADADDTSLTIVAGADINEGETGTFTVTSTKASAVDRVINFTVAGTANTNDVAGPDVADHNLNATGETVTLLAGQLSTVIEVMASDETATHVEEPVESIDITLAAGTGYGLPAPLPSSPLPSASLNILANDTPAVTIAVDNLQIDEAPQNNVATFTVTLSTEPMEDKTIEFTASTDDASAADYTLRDSSLNVLTPVFVVDVFQGNTTGLVTLTADAEVPAFGEANEDITLTLVDDGSGAYTLGNIVSATTTILANETPEASVMVSIPTVNETLAPTAAVFTVKLSHLASEAKVINYTITGDADSGDHNLVSGSVTIGVEQPSADVTLNVTDDNLEELSESVIFTIIAGTGYTVAPGTAPPPPPPAAPGPGPAPAPVPPTALSVATTTITANDEPVVTIAATDAHASEAGDLAEYEVTLSTIPMVDKYVFYTVSSSSTAAPTDYATLSGSVKIDKGTTTGTISLTAIDDELIEDPETVVLEIITNAASDYSFVTPEEATATIADDDVIVVSIDTTSTEPSVLRDLDASEASDPGFGDAAFTIVTPIAPSTDITINYSVIGRTASALPADHDATDSDSVTTGSVVLPAGNTSVTVTITATDDNLEELDEVFDIALTVGYGYVVTLPSTTNFTIDENDIPTATIVATDDIAVEENTVDPLDRQATYTVTLDRVPQNVKSVTYKVSTNSATPSVDHNRTDGTLTFGVGITEQTIVLTPIDDGFDEGDETVTITLDEDGSTGPNPYIVVLNTNDSDMATIYDDDAVATITASAANTAEENADTDITYTVFLTNPSARVRTISYSIAESTAPDDGTVTEGLDYTAIDPKEVDIAANATTQNFVVEVLADTDIEPDENLTVTLTTTASDTYAIDTVTPANSQANTVIYDDDNTVRIALDSSPANRLEEIANIGGGDYVSFRFTPSFPSGRLRTINFSQDTSGTFATLTADYDIIAYLNTLGSVVTVLNPTTVPLIAGSDNVRLDLRINADTAGEEDETITFVVDNGGTYNVAADPGDSATYTILDDDNIATVSTLTDTTNEEDADTITYTVSLEYPSARDRDVTITVNAGTAQEGTDPLADDFPVVTDGFPAFTKTVTVPGDITLTAKTVDFDIIINNDNVEEEDETLIVTVVDGITNNVDVIPDTAETTIYDDDNIVTISAFDATVNEEDVEEDTGAPATDRTITYTVTATHPSMRPREVSYAVTGSAGTTEDTVADHDSAATGTVIIPGGGIRNATFNIVVDTDSVIESDETVVVTLTDTTTDSYALASPTVAATTTIYDDDNEATVSTTVTTTNEEDAATTLTYTVTLTNPSERARVVTYSITDDGVVIEGVDYTAITTKEVTIPGSLATPTITFDVEILNDISVEPDEDVVVTIENGENSYKHTLPEASETVTIYDDDNEVTILVSKAATNEEDTDVLTYTVTPSFPSGRDRKILYAKTGSTLADDFTPGFSGEVTVGINNSDATFSTVVEDNAGSEPDETITITLIDDTFYDLGDPETVTTTIFDDDNIVEIGTVLTPAIEPIIAGPSGVPTNGVFRLTLDHPSNRARSVKIRVDTTGFGVALEGTDYDTLAREFTIPASTTVKTLDIPVVPRHDLLRENPESVTVVLEEPSGCEISQTLFNSNLQINDPVAGVTISQTTISTSESGTPASFTVVLKSQPTFPVTITISGAVPAEGALSDTTLTFNPTLDGAPTWDTPQVVTVTGVNDASPTNDGPADYQLTFASASTDPAYTGNVITPVAVRNLDNDFLLTVTSAGNGLVTPSTPIVLDSDANSVSPYTIEATPSVGYSFTGWTGLGTGALSSTADAKPTVTAGTTTDTTVEATFALNTVAIDAVGVIFLPESDVNTVDIDVKLDNQPSGDVTVTVAKSTTDDNDISITAPAGPNTLTFTPSDWDQPQTVTLKAVEDADVANGKDTITLTVTTSAHGSGIAIKAITAREVDDDITLTVNTDGTLGAAVSGEGIIDTTGTNPVAVDTVPANYHFTGWTDPSLILLNSTTVKSGVADTLDAATITANFAENTLTVSIDKTSISENGGTETATVTVTRPVTAATGDLSVTLSSDKPDQADVITSPVVITGSNTQATFTIQAVDDTFVDGTQTVTITATASGHTAGTDTIDVTDDAYTLNTVAGTGADPDLLTFSAVVDPDAGASVSVTASALAGYAIDTVTPIPVWTVTGGTATLATPGDATTDVTGVAIGATVELTAAFVANPVAVQVVSAPGTVSVPEAGNVTVTGVRLSHQPTGEVTVSISRTSGDTNISPTTTSLTFTTATGAGGWDTVQDVVIAADDDTDATNGTATITLTPNLGYSAATIDTVEVDNDFVLTLDSSDTNGDITSPSSPVNVDTVLSLPTIEATAKIGYKFVSWEVTSGAMTLGTTNLTEFGKVATVDVTGMTANSTLKAHFVVNPVVIEASDINVDESGNVLLNVQLSHQPAGGVTIQATAGTSGPGGTVITVPGVNDTITLTSSNWEAGLTTIRIDSGADDTDVVNNTRDITLTVTTNGHGPTIDPVTITATQIDDDWLVTYLSDGNGTITGTATQVVSHGGDATSVTATPDGGFTFVDWSDGVTTATRTDLNITGDKSVTANFVP